MNIPLISVIVPVYNVERFLPGCIESILSQTYTRLEVLLVNDGSTDNSGAICDEYAAKDSRIKVIHKSNGGVSSARNMGLQKATGKYVAFCDGDDCLRKDYLQTMHQLMAHMGADLAVCGFESVDEDGNIISGRRSENCVLDVAAQMLDNDLFWKLFQGKRIGSCWDKLFSMDRIRVHGLEFPLGVPFAEDTDFVLQYLTTFGDRCTVSLTNERLYLYLTQEHGSAVQKLRMDQWRFFERLIPMLEYYVSGDRHVQDLREYILSAARFVMDSLFRYKGVLPYKHFKEATADMLQSSYFRDAAASLQMILYNRPMTLAMKSARPWTVWLMYMIWKGKNAVAGKDCLRNRRRKLFC